MEVFFVFPRKIDRRGRKRGRGRGRRVGLEEEIVSSEAVSATHSRAVFGKCGERGVNSYLLLADVFLKCKWWAK